MKRTTSLISASALAILLSACATTAPKAEAEFTVRIENVSSASTLPVADSVFVPLAPGAYVVHKTANALFTPGGAASAGLEGLAEDGGGVTLATEVTGSAKGFFGTGPIGPAGTYEFSFDAVAGDALSFATMFVQSNDWFYAPDGAGIALFDGTTPISGDISDQLRIWDAGTEADELPGFGPNQAPRQAAPNTGAADENTAIRLVPESALANLTGPVVEATISSVPNGAMTTFTVTLTNKSTAATLLPAVAVPLSPGAWTVSKTSDVFFTSGEADRGEGLEAIAEDGSPTALVTALGSKVDQVAAFNTPVGATDPAPIFPGGAYEFSFTAEEGDYLNLTTMFIQSNDWIYSTSANGIALFKDGEAVTGDVSDQVGLYDVGTEADETPGTGANQAPRQAGPNTGAVDTNTNVRAATVTLNGEVVKVTLSKK